MSPTVTTNEWLNAATHRVPIDRPLLVYTAEGNWHVAYYTGTYWSDASTKRRYRPDLHPLLFYIFERMPLQ